MSFDPKHKSEQFFLEKWFLDLVTEDGDTHIFYAAELQWRKIPVRYASRLWLSRSGKNGQRSRFLKIQFPVDVNGVLTYNDPHFNVEGIWNANALPLSAKIFESAEGGLEWTCMQPASTVTVNSNGRELKGLGYAEKIVLTVYPWKLPMQQLRWGRFVSAKDYLVWIELKAETNRQWICYNGEKLEEAAIDDSGITIPSQNMHLRFTRTTVIESESKIYKVVKKMAQLLPGFRSLIPSGFLMAAEYKWRSRGILECNGATSEGWVIHEFVNFKTA